MKMIDSQIDSYTAGKRMMQGFTGIIRHGSNPYQVTAKQSFKATPVMTYPDGTNLFIGQLMEDGRVIAVASFDKSDL